VNKTKIEWCDYTWNPIVGCSPISAGCENCYAKAISHRFGLPWGSAHFIEDRLWQPEKVSNPSRIFVCSMSDMGHETVMPEWRRMIVHAMKRSPQHTFIVLTKRPGPWIKELPPECWVGVTIESAGEVWRWPELCYYAGKKYNIGSKDIKFISAEPLLESLQLPLLSEIEINPLIDEPDWVIAGPETGPGARQFNPEWLDELAKTSWHFFDKRKTGWGRREFPK